ncbi:MAG: tetratricopeptide repeat protein [Myxococcales bacterium]|nr:tetratricopeptide repeat protein [Myxococcales bacterium]
MTQTTRSDDSGSQRLLTDEVEALLSSEDDVVRPPAIPDDAPRGEGDGGVASDAESAAADAEPEVDAAFARERLIYRREADALETANQLGRAANTLLDCAMYGERVGASARVLAEDVSRALALAPQSTTLLARARRLMLRLGYFEEAIRIGQAEVNVGGDNQTRAAVLLEAAAVMRYCFGDSDAELKLLDRALRLTPRDIPALFRAASLYDDLARYEEAATALEQLSEVVSDAAERALCLYTTATLLEFRLGHDEQAEGAYKRAVEADPENIPALLSLVRLYERSARWTELTSIFERLAAVLKEPDLVSRVLQQAGALHLDLTRDLDGAVRDLSAAAKATPEDSTALRRLCFALEAKGRPEELAQALEALLERTHDAHGRAALLTQIGSLRLYELHDAAGAQAALSRALEEVPDYVPALQALGTLYRKQNDFDRLVAITSPQLEGGLPPSARAARYVELAEMLAFKLERADEAAAAFRRALELVPGAEQAFHGLAALLESQGEHAQLADLLLEQADQSLDPRTRAYLLMMRARLQERELGQLDQSLESLRAAAACDASRVVELELIAHYERAGKHVELASALLEHALVTEDTRERAGCRMRAAQVLERELEEFDQALSVYRQVLDDDPHDMAAIRGIGRILHRRGAWDDLLALNHHELVHQPDRPDAAVLLCRMGRILADHLGNSEAAIAAYSKALRHDPHYEPAISALERLATSERRWPDLVDVLDRYATARDDGPSAADAMCRAGEVAALQLSDLERAHDLFERALTQHPASTRAMHGLVSVCLRSGRHERAAEVLARLIAQVESRVESGRASDAARGDEPSEQQSVLVLELARLRELHLDDQPDLELYQLAARGPFGERLRFELLRVLRHTTRHGASLDGAAEWLGELGAHAADEGLALAHLLEATHMREWAGAGKSALAAIAEAYRRAPTNLATIWAYERVLAQADKQRELARLREAEAALELDRSLRVQRLVAAARAYADAGDGGDCERVCAECLELDASSIAAHRLRIELCERRGGAASELARLHDGLANACVDETNQLESALCASDLWERGGKLDEAIASLSVPLASDPSQPQAFARAESLLGRRGRFQDLSKLYRRRLRITEAPEERIELLRRHAQILHARLHRPEQAITELNALLSLSPDDSDALQALAALQGQLGHWSEAAATQARLVEIASAGEMRRAARLSLADLLLTRLHRASEARQMLEDAAAEHPQDLEIQRRMIELARTVGDWKRASALLAGLAAREGIDAATRIAALLDHAEVARLGLADVAACDESEARAVAAAIATADPAARDCLDRCCRSPEQARRVIAHMEAAIEQHDQRPEVAGALELLAARMWIERERDSERALAHLGRLAQRGVAAAECHVLIGRAYELSGERAAATSAFRAALERDRTSVEGYRGLARVGPPALAPCAAAMVAWLGEPDAEDTMSLATLAGDGLPSGQLPATAFGMPGVLGAMQRALIAAAPHLGETLPQPSGRPLSSAHVAHAKARRLAMVLALPEPMLYAAAGVSDVRVGVGDPLPLFIAPALLEQAQRAAPDIADGPLPGAILTFQLTRALFQYHGGGGLISAYSNEELDALLDALSSQRNVGDEAQALRRTLSRSLPRRVRKQLAELVGEVPRADWVGYRATLETSAHRIALAACRDPRAAIAALAAGRASDARAALASPEVSELLEFAASDGFATLLRTLWR